MADKPEMWRLFVALEIPETLRTKLDALGQYLRRFNLGARWVKPEGLHLTLKFLGDTSPDQVDALTAALAPLAGASPGLELSATGLGVFPNKRKPRVLWVGLGGDTEACIALASQIDEATGALGFPTENRPFTPHLTLARFKKRVSPKALDKALSQWGQHTFEPFVIDELVLFRSHLQSSGARYEPLARWPLGA